MTDWKDRFWDMMGKSDFNTIADVCKAAGVSNSTFGQALKGSHTPKVSTIAKVATVLGTTWQYLMNGAEKDLVIDSRVPLLSKLTLFTWLDQFTLDVGHNTIIAPEQLPQGSFAWRVNTSDLAPCFPIGSIAIMLIGDNISINFNHGRIFVLAEDLRCLTRQKSNYVFFDEHDDDFSSETESDETSGHGNLIFAELTKTIRGLRLIGEVNGISESLDAKNYKVIAKALYAIHRF